MVLYTLLFFKISRSRVIRKSLFWIIFFWHVEQMTCFLSPFVSSSIQFYVIFFFKSRIRLATIVTFATELLLLFLLFSCLLLIFLLKKGESVYFFLVLMVSFQLKKSFEHPLPSFDLPQVIFKVDQIKYKTSFEK